MELDRLRLDRHLCGLERCRDLVSPQAVTFTECGLLRVMLRPLDPFPDFEVRTRLSAAFRTASLWLQIYDSRRAMFFSIVDEFQNVGLPLEHLRIQMLLCYQVVVGTIVSLVEIGSLPGQVRL